MYKYVYSYEYGKKKIDIPDAITIGRWKYNL